MARVNVLIIEDEAVDAKLLQKQLREEPIASFTVTVASSGKEGLNTTQQGDEP